MLGNLDSYPSTGNPYYFTYSIIVTPAVSLMTGLILGATEVYLLHNLFHKQALWQKIFFKTVIYVIAIFLFLAGLAAINNSIVLNLSVTDRKVINTVILFEKDFSFWSIIIYTGALVLMRLLFAEVKDNIGQGVLKNFFTGKYRRPKAEERIFMFLDMKSSTAIAEKLGHVEYFKLLNRYYADMTESILEAGLHSGKVTTGEIGVMKKDIIFTGDVLNTTSRIQACCNEYAVDILVSYDIFAQLKTRDEFFSKEIGVCKLRGKDELVRLFTVWK